MRPFGHKRRESTVEQATLGTKSREVRRHVCVLTVNTPVENLRTLRSYIFQSPLTQATLDTQPDNWYQRDQLVKIYRSVTNSRRKAYPITVICAQLAERSSK